jgi:hypothetical protein
MVEIVEMILTQVEEVEMAVELEIVGVGEVVEIEEVAETTTEDEVCQRCQK